jgi:hypothetical protein
LGDDSNEFIIVYGVNHVATGKAMYSNFAVYGADVWNGARAITDAAFNGSAEEYLPDNPNAKYLYVYKLARNCSESDQYCYEVPYGGGSHGIELVNGFLFSGGSTWRTQQRHGRPAQR